MNRLLGVAAVVAALGCGKGGSGGDPSAICNAMSLASSNAKQVRNAMISQYESAHRALVLSSQWQHLDYDGKRQITPEQDEYRKYSGADLRADGYVNTALALCSIAYGLHDEVLEQARLAGVKRPANLPKPSGGREDLSVQDCLRSSALERNKTDERAARIAALKARGDVAQQVADAYTQACFDQLGGSPKVVHPLNVETATE